MPWSPTASSPERCWQTTEPEATGTGDLIPDACPRCGGAQIRGTLTLPILGQARFAYNLGGKLIETDVRARMCERCGHVALDAADPERIRKAHSVAARAGLVRD